METPNEAAGNGPQCFRDLHPSEGPLLAHSAFLAYSKLVFVIRLLSSLLGAESILRFSLDTKLFNFIAKVSLCTYLLHLTLTFIFLGNRPLDLYYGTVAISNLFAAHAVEAY